MAHIILFNAAVLSEVFDFILPIALCVVLPVICLWLTIRARQHEIDKKTELAAKAIENGYQIDPAILTRSLRPRSVRTAKERFFRKLKTGIILFAIGMIFFFMGLLMTSIAKAATMGLWMTASVFGCLGLGFIAIYFFGRREFADEIASEESFDIKTEAKENE